MRRTAYITYNTLGAIAMHTICFLCCGYPRHIFDLSIAEAILNVFFLLIHSALIVIAFGRMASVFDDRAFVFEGKKDKQRFILWWAGAFALQLVFELVVWRLGRGSVMLRYIGLDVLTALYWIAVCAIFAKKIWKNAWRAVITIAIFAVILLVFVMCDFSAIERIEALNQKYQETAPYLLRSVKNEQFLHSLRLCIADTCYFVALIVVCSFNISRCEDDENKKKREQKSRPARIFIAMIRSDVILSVAAILVVLNIAIGPTSVLHSEGRGSRDETSDREIPDSSYFLNSWQREHKKVNNSEACYTKAELKIYKGSSEPVKAVFNGAEEYYVQGAKTYDNFCHFSTLSVNGQKYYVYSIRVICFYANDSMKIIFVEDLAEMEEDQIVTDILEHLLENGNLFAFEHGYEYLIKYDQEFIQPYIERYAQGDYNKAELTYINNLRYRNDYIQNIAKSVVTQ